MRVHNHKHNGNTDTGREKKCVVSMAVHVQCTLYTIIAVMASQNSTKFNLQLNSKYVRSSVGIHNVLYSRLPHKC